MRRKPLRHLAARDLEHARRGVDRGDAHIGVLLDQQDRDIGGAGAEIEDVRTPRHGQQIHRTAIEAPLGAEAVQLVGRVVLLGESVEELPVVVAPARGAEMPGEPHIADEGELRLVVMQLHVHWSLSSRGAETDDRWRGMARNTAAAATSASAAATRELA